MAVYMPQPDSGDNCCDCPSRASPCDDCGGTGACCIDGECSILSETDCTDGGGNYLGDDSVCEGVDCTQGACCSSDDGSCFLDTSECADYGPPYSYQGDGTVCDPNPCPLPCCFAAFDGSGRMFGTITYELTGYSDSFLTCSTSASGTNTENCIGGCDCSGSMTRTGPGACESTFSVCASPSWDPYDPSTWSLPQTAPGVLGCGDGSGCTSCCNVTESLSSDSATIRVFDIEPTISCTGGASGSITVTLSDECLSMGGAFEDPFFQNN